MFISALYAHDLTGHDPKVEAVLQLVSPSEALNHCGEISSFILVF
jgi:hypothetical protein